MQGNTETRVKVKLYIYGPSRFIEVGTAAAAPATEENVFVVSLSVVAVQYFAVFSQQSKTGV